MAEVKTDLTTFKEDAADGSQLMRRILTLSRKRPIRALRHDLKVRKNDNRYGKIGDRLDNTDHSLDDPIELLVIYPVTARGVSPAFKKLREEADSKSVIITGLTFHDLRKLELPDDPTWNLFRDIVLETLVDEPSARG